MAFAIKHTNQIKAIKGIARILNGILISFIVNLHAESAAIG